jgi:hypothetical protein
MEAIGKNASLAVVATVLLFACFPFMVIGLIFLMIGLNIKGIAIYFLGLVMWAAGTILGNQQKQQLGAAQIAKKAGSHFGFGVIVLIVFITVRIAI